MNLARNLYDHGQDLLVLSWECHDQNLASAMRKIAHALLDSACAEDRPVEAPAVALVA
jgi:hypothetical protein